MCVFGCGGYGDPKPIPPNWDTFEGRESNEKVEIKNLDTGKTAWTTISMINPNFKKKHLTQADIDRLDPPEIKYPLYKRIGIWFCCAVFCVAGWLLIWNGAKAVQMWLRG
jgi:hypothetical protein